MASARKKVMEMMEETPGCFVVVCRHFFGLNVLFPTDRVFSWYTEEHVGLTTSRWYISHFTARQDKLETRTTATTQTQKNSTNITHRPSAQPARFQKIVSTVDSNCGAGLDSRALGHVNAAIHLSQGSPKPTTTQYYSKHGRP